MKMRELRSHNLPQWFAVSDPKPSSESVLRKAPPPLNTASGTTLGAVPLTRGLLGGIFKIQTTAEANHSSQVRATGIRDWAQKWLSTICMSSEGTFSSVQLWTTNL